MPPARRRRGSASKPTTESKREGRQGTFSSRLQFTGWGDSEAWTPMSRSPEEPAGRETSARGLGITRQGRLSLQILDSAKPLWHRCLPEEQVGDGDRGDDA